MGVHPVKSPRKSVNINALKMGKNWFIYDFWSEDDGNILGTFNIICKNILSSDCKKIHVNIDHRVDLKADDTSRSDNVCMDLQWVMLRGS